MAPISNNTKSTTKIVTSVDSKANPLKKFSESFVSVQLEKV
jgi:hypothetical protein